MQQHQISVQNPNNNLLKGIKHIYEASFPEDERRDFEDLLEIAKTEPAFHADIYAEGENILGFITHWHFADFAYVEHFAVHESTRGKGYGKLILQNLLSQVSLPIVLEVERPEDETSKRRIRFYESMGFTLSEKPYLQPPYCAGKNAVPLYLMYYGEVDMDKSFDNIKNELYKKVYNT